MPTLASGDIKSKECRLWVYDSCCTTHGANGCIVTANKYLNDRHLGPGIPESGRNQAKLQPGVDATNVMRHLNLLGQPGQVAPPIPRAMPAAIPMAIPIDFLTLQVDMLDVKVQMQDAMQAYKKLH